MPPSLRWKYQYLEEQSTASINALEELDRKENKELEKLEEGYDSRDVSLIIWAGADIVSLRKKMEEEEPLRLCHLVQRLFNLRETNSIFYFGNRKSFHLIRFDRIVEIESSSGVVHSFSGALDC